MKQNWVPFLLLIVVGVGAYFVVQSVQEGAAQAQQAFDRCDIHINVGTDRRGPAEPPPVVTTTGTATPEPAGVVQVTVVSLTTDWKRHTS